MAHLIRGAVESDRDVAARLLIAQLVEHHLPADPQGVARGIELAMKSASAWLLLAFSGEEAVGVFLANEIVSVEKSGRVLWVEELYVVPSARRQGVARAMLEYVREEARKKGIVAVELEVVPTQEAAFALYRSMGFVDVDRTRMSWGM
ncbi:MAG TPA: GNAT family N-acetyltransferase [Tepidisphaeraceae bacterium]|jgi:GNAT superfamily N-acetyltransferase|nr:GNAT family N-acetyltransferase [Tepidisphaeraceae bacterium]